MLRRLFLRTKLGQQIAEARKAHRELKIAEYRIALRAKRAAVRAAIIRELRRKQLDDLLESRNTALALVKQVHAARRSPGTPAGTSQMKRGAEKGLGNVLENDAGEILKADVIQQVTRMVPETSGSPSANAVLNNVVKQTLADIKVDPVQDRGSMAAQMVASVAVDTEMDRKEMEELVDSLQWDDLKVKQQVLKNVLEAMEKAKSAKESAS